MNIDAGLIMGGIAAAGAIYRAYKGYQSHMKKRNYEPFSWKTFLVSVVPAISLAFVAGATFTPMPDLFSSEGLTIAVMFFTGGAGIASLQTKLPFKKPTVK